MTEAVEQYLPLFDDLSLKGFEDISQVIDSGVSERPYWADNARTWVLDPIDGTKGFLRGEQFCIALSLIEDGEVKLGLLACPNLSQQPGIKPNGRDEGGVIFSAELGHGASSSSIDMKGNLGEATPLEVDRLTPVVDMKRCESVESSHSMHDVAYGVANALNMKADPVRMDGQGKYGVISRGDAHLFLRLPRNNYQEYIWDVAAGYRILSEAGGHVTDLIGHPLNFSPVTVDGVPGLEGAKLDASVKGIVATTNSPGFHQSVISSLRSLLHVTQ